MRRRDSKYVVQMATVSSQQSSLSTEILQENVNSRLRSRRHGLSNDISNYLALISIRRRSEMDSWPRFGLMKNQAASFHTSQAIRKRNKPRQPTMLEWKPGKPCSNKVASASTMISSRWLTRKRLGNLTQDWPQSFFSCIQWRRLYSTWWWTQLRTKMSQR